MNTKQSATDTDPAGPEWLLHDELVRLRQWASDKVFPLPTGIGPFTVGASESCDIQLDDPNRQISRRHAQLERDDAQVWVLRDLGSKNKLRVDGARVELAVLEPGLEIGIGGVTLLAESTRAIALRSFLKRIIGYAGQDEAVDLALRAIRLATKHRAPLVITSAHDALCVARSIHRLTRGAERPFVLCDPRREVGESNYERGLDALANAVGGTLCFRSDRLPDDVSEAMATLRGDKPQVQIFICGPGPRRTKASPAWDAASPIVVPPLTSRPPAEIVSVVSAYGSDAVASLGPQAKFSTADRDWVVDHDCATLTDIERAALRLVALRLTSSMTGAAKLLGLNRQSLSDWWKSRTGRDRE